MATTNRYGGYTTPSPAHIDRITLETEEEEKAFFIKYVAARRPAVIQTIPPELGPTAAVLAEPDLASLVESAGPSTLVEIEIEAGPEAPRAFGYGKRKTMPLQDGIASLLAEGGAYLSTQKSNSLHPQGGEKEDPGRVHVSAPAHGLIKAAGLPLFPSFASPLLTESINLWIGNSGGGEKGGTSSGLHHDFHDNVYLLGQGKKTFVLFDPSHAVEDMATFGQISTVHPNGLVVYADAFPVDQNGVELSAKAAFGAPKIEGDDQDDDDDELAMERALEAAMNNPEMFAADFDDDDDFDISGGGGDHDLEGKGEGEGEGEEKEPNHFSSLAPHAIPEHLPRMVVELEAGEMLYLPCGWFHEVTSSGGVHVALNYWFYPPTLHAEPHLPYESRYWSHHVTSAHPESCIPVSQRDVDPRSPKRSKTTATTTTT